MEKLIITVAPTNTKWFKKDNPFMPETPSEIAEDAIRSFREGAAVAHIHARDEKGKATFDSRYFREIVDRIRSETDMIIQLSTAGGTAHYTEKLASILELRSEMASLNIRGTDEEIEYNARFMKEHGIVPIIEAFDLEMIEKANRLIEKGMVNLPAHFELVFDLEDPTGKPLLNDLDELSRRVRTLYPGSTWSRNRGAHNQFALDAFTILLGGHLRVGLEDNLFISPNLYARESAEFVRRVRTLCEAVGRKIATPGEAREMIHRSHSE